MCKNRPWRECCNDCKQLEYCCYIRKDIVKVKIYIEHLGEHYDDPGLHLTCSMCRVNKHISFFRFRNARRRICIYLDRYRFGHTSDRYKEHVKIYNI